MQTIWKSVDTCGAVQQGDLEALPVGPARVHALQHLRPVLRVCAARASLHCAIANIMSTTYL